MGNKTLLLPEEKVHHMSSLKGWIDGGNFIARKFEFADFKQAISFMMAAALKAEQMNHHPDWSNVYNRVEVQLSTHDAGGLTALDFELAKWMDDFADQSGR